MRGELAFEDVSFRYDIGEEALLSDVRRYGQMDNVKTVLSGALLPEPAGAHRGETERRLRSSTCRAGRTNRFG